MADNNFNQLINSLEISNERVGDKITTTLRESSDRLLESFSKFFAVNIALPSAIRPLIKNVDLRKEAVEDNGDDKILEENRRIGIFNFIDNIKIASNAIDNFAKKTQDTAKKMIDKVGDLFEALLNPRKILKFFTNALLGATFVVARFAIALSFALIKPLLIIGLVVLALIGFIWVLKQVAKFGEWLGEKLFEGWTYISEGLSKFLDSFKESVRGILTWILNRIRSAVNSLISGFSFVSDFIVDLFKKLGESRIVRTILGLDPIDDEPKIDKLRRAANEPDPSTRIIQPLPSHISAALSAADADRQEQEFLRAYRGGGTSRTNVVDASSNNIDSSTNSLNMLSESDRDPTHFINLGVHGAFAP